MKSMVIIALISLCISSLDAQKCQYLTNKVSGMDGSRLVITNTHKLSTDFNEGLLEVWSTLMGDTAVIVAFVISSDKQYQVRKGDRICIMLENDSAVYFQIIQDALSSGTHPCKITAMTVINSMDIPQLESLAVRQISVPLNSMELKGIPKNKQQARSIDQIIGCVKVYLKNQP
jgi:hypothetical protein